MDVIVNADDLGMSPEINEAIFELVEQGLVTSATLLANGPSVEEACSQVSRFPGCSFGAHLNITEFQPVGASSKLEPLLDETGEFQQRQIRQVPMDSSLAEGIFEEFCAQIEKLKSLGIQVSHLDSHHYVLSSPRMFSILKKIQKKYHIRKARITRNIYADGLITRLGITPYALGVDPHLGDSDVGVTLRVKKWAYNFLLRHYFPTKTTDGFSGFRLFYESARLGKMDHRTFEANVHPGNSYYHPEEVEILKGPWRDALSFPVRLISYHEIQ